MNKDICEIADTLEEGKLYYAVCKNGEKIRVQKNYNCDIEKHITGILTTWRIYDDEYPDLTYEDWGYQEIEYHIASFEAIPETNPIHEYSYIADDDVRYVYAVNISAAAAAIEKCGYEYIDWDSLTLSLINPEFVRV